MRWQVTVSAGNYDRRSCPVLVKLSDPVDDPHMPPAVKVDSTALIHAACQLAHEDDGIWMRFVIDELAAGTNTSFVVDTEAGQPEPVAGVAVKPRTNAVDITVAGKPFTTLNCSEDAVRPFFHPVAAPDGRRVTRGFPMETDIPGEKHDHKHHRSLYVAHGDINGHDLWSEEAKHGRQVQENVHCVQSGCVCGYLGTTNAWLTADGKRLMSDRRCCKFHSAGPAMTILDFAITFCADSGEVRFGDTKEGGLISVRVAGTMKGASGGLVTNAYGAMGEGDCWGKASPWVDYSGTVDGASVGVAIFDHPLNLRYPTRWHVRDYGLFAVNPFALGDYRCSFETNGDYSLPAGGELQFRYRICFHTGDCSTARIAGRYLDYVAPPVAEVAPV